VPLHLAVTHVFAIIEAERELFRHQWRITTRMYDYSLLDHDQTELLVYHWQPDADPAHPHLHVSAALRARTSAVGGRTIDLDSLHLATGRVSLETMIRMLIMEFEVAPQRRNWRETLDRTETLFRTEVMQRV
jgi:hypothetical protein